MHTSTLDRLFGVNETLKCVLVKVTRGEERGGEEEEEGRYEKM